MPSPKNKKLYARAKAKVVAKNPKHSAYRSSQIVKEYKKMGGTYSGSRAKGKLTRWFKEDWRSQTGKKVYKKKGDIFRPTKRVSKDTPTTMGELTKAQKARAMKEKKATGRVKKFKK